MKLHSLVERDPTLATIGFKQANPNVIVISRPFSKTTSHALLVSFPNIVSPVIVEFQLFGT